MSNRLAKKSEKLHKTADAVLAAAAVLHSVADDVDDRRARKMIQKESKRLNKKGDKLSKKALRLQARSLEKD